MYRFYTPPPPLSAFVATFWLYVSDLEEPSRVLPSGTAQLVIDLSGDGLCLPSPSPTGRSRGRASALLRGVDTTSFFLENDRPIYELGVDFTPGGAYPFFAPPASALQNVQTPLDALWGAQVVRELRERVAEAQTLAERTHLLEQELLRQMVRPLAHHPAVTTALRALSLPRQGGEQRDEDGHFARITQVAEAAGVSRRRLTQVFGEEVGLTPKQFARVQRFLATLRRIGAQQRIDWAQLALACGYYDQAHLINEFRAFAGVCPSAYLRDRDARSPTTLRLAK